VLERVRSNPVSANLPIVVVTGYGAEGVRTRAFAAGADGFISKPFRQEDLLTAMAEAITIRRQ
jgi:CheY-like chemotaxis protein